MSEYFTITFVDEADHSAVDRSRPRHEMVHGIFAVSGFIRHAPRTLAVWHNGVGDHEEWRVDEVRDEETTPVLVNGHAGMVLLDGPGLPQLAGPDTLFVDRDPAPEAQALVSVAGTLAWLGIPTHRRMRAGGEERVAERPVWLQHHPDEPIAFAVDKETGWVLSYVDRRAGHEASIRALSFDVVDHDPDRFTYTGPTRPHPLDDDAPPES